MRLTIPQRVDKGIELLETYLPDGRWALEVDPETLDMSTTRHCMLGQLLPHFDKRPSNSSSPYISASAWIAHKQVVVPVHENGDWTADYGFQSAISEWRGDMDEFDQIYPDLNETTYHTEYEMLDDEWIKRINQIREASDG